MTLATTETRVGTVLESVAGIGQVHNRIRTEIDRDLAEGYFLDGSDRINCWEYEVSTETVHDHCDGLFRSEPVVDIVAHYFLDDAGDSRQEFRDLLTAASEALMNVTSGFPQIKEGGVQLVERPTPVRIRTGHAALRARLQFRLWDSEPT